MAARGRPLFYGAAMNDQYANLLHAILLELRCMNEALRTTASQGDAMQILKHEGESIISVDSSGSIEAAAAQSEQSRRLIFDAIFER